MLRDLWKGLTVAVLGISLTVSSFLIPFHWFLPAWAHRLGSYNIKSGEYRSLSISLTFGSIVRGMVIVAGGDDQIGFLMEDSGGNIVINEEWIHDKYFFEFPPSKTDSYIVILDNGDYSDEKSVFWIVWIYYYNILFSVLGIGLFAIGMVVIFKEERTQSSKFFETIEKASKAFRKNIPVKSSNLRLKNNGKWVQRSSKMSKTARKKKK